ncbi:MAG: RelA/SpoT domain-containing protein [Desulfobulbaceae bacterium]|nr:RelA/SpoT domain-containing protein [Desulfobulbaceae bacterium]
MAVRYKALRLQTCGEKAEQSLQAALVQSKIFSKCYAHKSRVKNEKKLLEKVTRKQSKKPEYCLSHITDVIGVRFVTLFRLEMPEVFEHLIKIINHDDGLNPNPFCKGVIEEVIIYETSRYDDNTRLIKEVASKQGIGHLIKVEQSEQGYSSIHVVTRLQTQPGGETPPWESYKVPVEFQIRTVYEDAWGEVDHKYGYVLRQGKEAGEPIENPESVMRHLVVLKKFSDACAEYANAIHIDASPPGRWPTLLDKTGVVSVAQDDELLANLEKLGIGHDVISLFVEAREKREKALSPEFGPDRVRLLLGVAETFRELALAYEDKIANSPTEGEYLFYYYASMNEAFCLISTNTKENVRAALNKYNRLSEYYKDYPLVLMREGQALGKIGFTESSIEKLDLAYNLLKKFESEGSNFSNFLPEVDYKHMKKFLPLVYGYQLWKKVNTIEDATGNSAKEKKEILLKAYELTTEATEFYSEDEVFKIHNNLLYYAMDIIGLCNEAEGDSDGDLCRGMEKNITIHLSTLLRKFDATTNTNINLLDTLVRAHIANKDYKNAKVICDRLLDLCLGSEVGYIYENETRHDLAEKAYANKKIIEKELAIN